MATTPAGHRVIFARILPAVLLLVGAAISAFGFWNLQRARESLSWPTANGVVRHASVEYRTSHSGTDEGSGPTYHAEIHYEFAVDGMLHSGSRVSYGDFDTNFPSHAQSIVNRYRPGTTVAVFYRPSDPDDCVLEPGISLGAWITPTVGLAFLAAGPLIAIWMPRIFRKEDETARTDIPAGSTVAHR